MSQNGGSSEKNVCVANIVLEELWEKEWMQSTGRIAVAVDNENEARKTSATRLVGSMSCTILQAKEYLLKKT